jgi:hypothetical protein
MTHKLKKQTLNEVRTQDDTSSSSDSEIELSYNDEDIDISDIDDLREGKYAIVSGSLLPRPHFKKRP